MSAATATLPRRRSDLVLRALGDGRNVVKDPGAGTYFNMGEQEFFLLDRLDGTKSTENILEEFEQRFSELIAAEDLNDFVEMARGRGLLHQPGATPGKTPHDSAPLIDDDGDDEYAPQTTPSGRKRQSILFYRKSLYDPDRLFTALEPHIRWIWSVEFMILSMVAIGAACLVVLTSRNELVSAFPQGVRWESLVLVWVTLVLATTCHEFAHGLTCKHFGGEVHEVGVLLMFFTPCFFCNISDAWLIREKWKRLSITLAGAYCDLCLWSIAVFVWRVTMQHTLVNYLSWVVLSVCGARILFNFNPLMKLDGYYILSDWLELPNLRKRGWERWLALARWFLWGGPRPEASSRSRALTLYGMISWGFSLAFLSIMLVNMARYLSDRGNYAGVSFTLFLGYFTVQRLLNGFSSGEFWKMITTRHKRTAAWLGGLAAAAAVLCLFRMEERAAGVFHVRPGARFEVRAKVDGFLKEVYGTEGVRVTPGGLVARIEVPDLKSLIVQKAAAVEESTANLRRLKVGSRPEEVAEQRLRVERARGWRDLAQQDLESGRQALQEELAHLDQQIAQSQTELNYARQSVVQSERLFKRQALAGEQLRGERKKLEIAEAQWQQSLARKRTREAGGVLQFEAELARREKDLADTEAQLSLLEAGSRPEEIDAERARLARFQEELTYYKQLETKLMLRSPVGGLITTPRMQEMVGKYFAKGELICTIENISQLEVEIAIAEDEAAGVQIGQGVELKARAFPMQTFRGQVDRIAPVAVTSTGESQGTVAAYCHVDNPQGELRSGMTGYGRVYRKQQPLAVIMGRRALRYVRTEFWW